MPAKLQLRFHIKMEHPFLEHSRWETEQKHKVSVTCHTQCGSFYTLAVLDITFSNSRQLRRTLWHLVKIGLTWWKKLWNCTLGMWWWLTHSAWGCYLTCSLITQDSHYEMLLSFQQANVTVVLPSEWWERMRRFTQAAPAPEPKMVILSGSPPKWPMFSFSQRRAWIWSNKP